MKKYTMIFKEVDKENFEALRSGTKAIETRAASPKYQNIAVGDEITFTCGNDSFSKIISKKYHWVSIDVMVQEIPFKTVMPYVSSIGEMKKVYASYPEYEEKIKEFGLLGFEFE